MEWGQLPEALMGEMLFVRHLDPPWEDFSRNTTLDLFKSQIIESLKPLTSASQEPIVAEGEDSYICTIPLPLCWFSGTPTGNPLCFQLRCNMIYDILDRVRDSAKTRGQTTAAVFKDLHAHSATLSDATHLPSNETAVFRVGESMTLTLYEQDAPAHYTAVTIGEEFATLLLSALSSVSIELKLDLPCFVALNPTEATYVGAYLRIGRLNTLDGCKETDLIQEPVLIRFLSTRKIGSDPIPSAQRFSNLYWTFAKLPIALDASMPVSQETVWYFMSKEISFHYRTLLCTFSACGSSPEVASGLVASNLSDLLPSAINACPASTFTVEVHSSRTRTHLQDVHLAVNPMSCRWKVKCGINRWSSHLCYLFMKLLERFTSSLEGTMEEHIARSVQSFKRFKFPTFAKNLLFRQSQCCFAQRVASSSSVAFLGLDSQLIKLGLRGAPVGSFVSDLAWFACGLPFEDIVKLWRKCIDKFQRRWNRLELIPRVGLKPDGPKGLPHYSDCDVQQQLAVLNCCIQQRWLSSEVKRLTQEMVPLSSVSNMSLTRPLIPIFPPHSTVGLSSLRETVVQKRESDSSYTNFLPLFEAMRSFQFANRDADFEQFTIWWTEQYGTTPITNDLFDSGNSAVPSDEELLKKWVLVWEAVRERVSTKPLKIKIAHHSTFNPTELAEPALKYLESLSMQDLLKMLLHVFVNNCLALWNYEAVSGIPVVSQCLAEFMSFLSEMLALDEKPRSQQLTRMRKEFTALENTILLAVYLKELFPHSLQLVNQLVKSQGAYSCVIEDQEELDNMLSKLQINHQDPSEATIRAECPFEQNEAPVAIRFVYECIPSIKQSLELASTAPPLCYTYPGPSRMEVVWNSNVMQVATAFNEYFN